MNHNLKTVQPYFQRLVDKQKTFELRVNDRDFQTGDTVALAEWDNKQKMYTGNVIEGEIIYVLKDYKGIEKGYCIFGFNETGRDIRI